MVESKTSGVVVRHSASFIDPRGSITNIAIGEFRCVSLIHSNAGAWRSKHYHRTDSHVLYVQFGEMHYWERELDGVYSDAPTIVRAGESIFTPALVVHKTFFPRATALVSMSKNPRDHASHEGDLVRVDEP